jgi:hypothetical protein
MLNVIKLSASRRREARDSGAESCQDSALPALSQLPARPRCRRFNPWPASSHCPGRRHTNLAQDQLHASYKKVNQQYEQISSEFF